MSEEATKSKPLPKGLFRAFTVKASGPMLSIRFNIGIAAPVPGPEGIPDDQITSFVGIINTGQPTSQLNKKVAEKLNITPTVLRGHEVYLVDIYLPNRIRFSGVPMLPVEDPNKECVLGMDVLACGDLAISNVDRKTTFSFRVPSGRVVDFVEESKQGATDAASAKSAPIKTNPVTMVDRNQLCVCGSGKKYKNCCGKYQH